MPNHIARDEADRQITEIEAVCHDLGKSLALRRFPLSEDNLEAIAERIVDEVDRSEHWRECFNDETLRQLGYARGVSAFSLAMRAICIGFHAGEKQEAA